MRGIILAGGTGSRLGRLTRVVNKHLLPVGDRPMIEHAIRVMYANGIGDITIVSTPRGVGQIAELLGGGYSYRVQENPGGIVDALLCAGARDQTQHIVLMLGDNMFFPRPVNLRKNLPATDGYFAHCFLSKQSPSDLRELGVATIDGDRIVRVTEKPEKPESDYAVTGLYVFDRRVFGYADGMKTSSRGEKEITDLLQCYADDRRLTYDVIDTFWGDAGTMHGLANCNIAYRQYLSEIRAHDEDKK